MIDLYEEPLKVGDSVAFVKRMKTGSSEYRKVIMRGKILSFEFDKAVILPEETERITPKYFQLTAPPPWAIISQDIVKIYPARIFDPKTGVELA